MVGFQNHLRFGEQQRVFRMIPGLEQARFLRLGQVHRNTFINAPLQLKDTLQSSRRSDLFFAGQISGVEGYVECIATGLVAGVNAARFAAGRPPLSWPRSSAIGSLLNYLVSADPNNFQPENINFGILPPASTSSAKIGRKEKRRLQTEIALKATSRLADGLSMSD